MEHVGGLVYEWGWLTLVALTSVSLIFWAGQFFVVGVVLCIVGCSVATLASSHEMPVAAPPQSWQSKVSPDIAQWPCGQHQPSLPRWRTTALGRSVWAWHWGSCNV